jgi:uncharacterized protein involved in type VI secretion and phage assembly
MFVPDGSAPGLFGVYPAVVTDIVDPDSLGRVEVRFPWLTTEGDRDARYWARLCSPYADDDQGLQIMPSVDSEVVVAFEAGNLRRPYVIGATWNGTTDLPRTPQSANNLRVLRTRSGSEIEFDDTAGAEKITVSTESGHKVVLDNSAREVLVAHSDGCTVKLTSTAVEVNANVSVDVTAPLVNVDAAVSTFSGVVKATTFIADVGVVSPMYTPGVGNVW